MMIKEVLQVIYFHSSACIKKTLDFGNNKKLQGLFPYGFLACFNYFYRGQHLPNIHIQHY